MRTRLLIALVATLPALAEDGIDLSARWEESTNGARVVADGTAEVPDGSFLDVAVEFEGAPISRVEAEVHGGVWHAEVALSDWGYAGNYEVLARYDPISQDRAPRSHDRALRMRFAIERGKPQDAAAARWNAAQAIDGVASIVRDAVARGRRAMSEPDAEAGVARETDGIEAGLLAAQAEAWPYLPLSRAAVDRLRGWARGCPRGGHTEALAAWFAIGERLAAALERTVAHEREGRGPVSENAPRPVSAAAMDAEAAATAAREETADEAIDALGPALARLGRDGVERLRPLLSAEPPVARRAARCLGWVPQAGAVEALRKAVSSQDAAIRAEVIRSLGRLGDRTSAQAVQRALEDGSPTVRAAAVEALVLLGDPDLAPFLFPLAVDPAPEVGQAAREAVRRLAGDWPADLPDGPSDGAPEALRRWWLERSGRP